MKIDILIPCHYEQYKYVTRLVKSIDIQQRIDFNNINVYILNDGPSTPDYHLVQHFDLVQLDNIRRENLHIDYTENGGVSATRNKLFDWSGSKSCGDYVMWCDSDDSFSDVYALKNIFELIDVCGNPDGVICPFWEQTKNGMMLHPQDGTFIHGKVYSRGYLNREHVVWDNDLTIHEDSYFNALALNCSDTIKWMDRPLYTWMWRDTSVCRRDQLYLQKTLPKFLLSQDRLYAQLRARGYTNFASDIFINTIAMLYYRVFMLDWNAVPELLDEYNSYTAQFVKRNRDLWQMAKEADEEQFSTRMEFSLAKQRNIWTPKMMNEPMSTVKQGFYEWFNGLENKSGKALEECI